MILKQTEKFKLTLVCAATALIAYSVLTLEIVFTRIFSVMLSYHFVFAVISSAMLGLGIGAMLLQKWTKWLPRCDYSMNAALFSIAIPISVIIVIELPALTGNEMNNFTFWIYIVLATLPFFFAGMSLAGIFQELPQKSSIVYGADLIGATLGALLVVPLLNNAGGFNSALFTSLTAVIASFLLSYSRKSPYSIRTIGISALALIIAAIGWFGIKGEVAVLRNPDKDMYRMIANPAQQARIVESRWSAFGRTDLVRSQASPWFMTIYIDGSAGSPMYNLDAVMNVQQEQDRIKKNFGAYFPFYFLNDHEKDHALVMGSGGGREVVISLLGGVKEITAIEVNPDVIEIVKDYQSFNGGIYTDHPQVKVILAEGRNYIRSHDKRYDLIMLAIPVTKSSRSVEGFALTESFMFTVESMKDYLAHLTPEGRIVLVAHSGPEIYRLLTLALTAFADRGISLSEAMKYIYMMASGPLPTMVIQNKPFDRVQAEKRYQKMHELGYDKLFFIPYGEQILKGLNEEKNSSAKKNTLDKVMVALSAGNLRLKDLLRVSPFDITPVTDDSPFFYKLKRGMPQPFGVFLFLILMAIGLIIGLLLIQSRPPNSKKLPKTITQKFALTPQLKHFVVIFFCLGIGFMLIEIALFQKLTLFIGQPILALTVLLFSLLIGSGLGSLASGSVSKQKGRAVIVSSITVCILTIVYTIFHPHIFDTGLETKTAAALMLLPLGFVMGFPFPLSIRLMRELGISNSIHWMWGTNGIASVLGSALTMIIGILIGFSYALFIGAFAYLVVSFSVMNLVRSTKVN